MSFTKRQRSFTAALLMSLSSATGLLAQQIPNSGSNESPGVFRISDRGPRSTGATIQQSGFHRHAMSAPCPNCPPGGANGMVSGYGTYCPNGNCPPQGHDCPFGCQGHYCKHSPDYGYSPPSKYPLLRRGVQYSEYFPAHWYGTGYTPASTAPMVYQPTDTTQLGFYYQHVPFWQPDPSRLPARPIPAQWNITPPAVQAYQFPAYGYTAGYGYNAGYYGHGHHHGHLLHRHRGYSAYDMNCPVDGTIVPQTTVPQSTAPTPIPTQPEVAPVQPVPTAAGSTLPEMLPGEVESITGPSDLPPSPAPGEGRDTPTESASSEHIRRLGNRN